MKNKGERAGIRLRGVRQNNLKNFDIDLPLGKLILITGLSGAGKSSLAFETLHAEGQRRYVETFSTYTRQFLELLDPPQVKSIDPIPASIAIEQGHTVRTSRSSVGTMTELCDFFKVWFCHVSALFDPDTQAPIRDDTPQTIWQEAHKRWPQAEVLVTFRVVKPEALSWRDIGEALLRQGYSRIVASGCVTRIDPLAPVEALSIQVIQDCVTLAPQQQKRFVEAATTALHFGRGDLLLLDTEGSALAPYAQGLRSPATGKRFRPASPALFSFNSPVGACPRCRGFGRMIEIDYGRVIQDPTRSIANGAIKAFQGTVYSESQRDLLTAARRHGVRCDIPWQALTDTERAFVLEGEPDYARGKHRWYGVKRFFNWLETQPYKMHVRVFLSKYRTYTPCPDCGGTRFQPEALNWKWNGYRLPDLYALSISELLEQLRAHVARTGNPQADLAVESMLARLNYLEQVGLGYLTLDRASRTLSGGEVQRVNLTTCIGTSLVDALFVLDEPSIGLHPRDIERLVVILKRLTALGNTVVVVEHDETIIRAADHILELGPEPGKRGGHLTFSGDLDALCQAPDSLTGAYLSYRETLDPPAKRRAVLGLKTIPSSRRKRSRSPPSSPSTCLHFQGVSKHNLDKLSFSLPLHRFVGISGVSGSGKSTLLDAVIYQGCLRHQGRPTTDPAEIQKLDSDVPLSEVALINQSPVSRTVRSNIALFSGIWDDVRKLFATTDGAREREMNSSFFSFNSLSGRCPHCKGLGYEVIEMQFLADTLVTCPECEGQRFRPETLDVQWKGKHVAEILKMEVAEAAAFFHREQRIQTRLQTLLDVGLGYLPLGQPLSTLSGGEAQRLKLVRYLSHFGKRVTPALLLLDEPTTGLHRHDVKSLILVLQRLVDYGHSLVVVEHHIDVLKSADWLIEMGPESGRVGGKIIACGPPETIARTATAPFLRDALRPQFRLSRAKRQPTSAPPSEAARQLCVIGARQHNLKNLSFTLPHGEIAVITGVSGSGKSSLAFDIIFAEGQRRFMEAMSPYACQFVEQMPKPDVDRITGIPPTVAIEQRVTHGTYKSTVATVTEVAHYLRLLYARLGIQHNPKTGQAVKAFDNDQLRTQFEEALRLYPKTYLCAPLVRARKGHHQSLATWAQKNGYQLLRCDGALVFVDAFQPLDRYREHDVEVVIVDYRKSEFLKKHLDTALAVGNGSCFLLHAKGQIWFSNTRTDPVTGESFPELDPKHFSWHSPKGWCPTCKGQGRLDTDLAAYGALCPDCQGERLNPVSRAVKLYFDEGSNPLSLPQLLSLSAQQLIERLQALTLDRRGRVIARDIRIQIKERLCFMEQIGLSYMSLDRPMATLSGGEVQRIRLAAQLSSNLSGALYVLDEPSIGLHAHDIRQLLASLKRLCRRGNSLLVVEHDEDTLRQADRILDIGPGAGRHGGELMANGSLKTLLSHPHSLTGRYLKSGLRHPVRGAYRSLPPPWNPRQRRKSDWLIARGTRLRNLKGDDLYLPLQRLIVVCGVSGSGKSTLVRDLLKPAMTFASQGKCPRLDGHALVKNKVIDAPDLPLDQLMHADRFRSIIEVDQTPIGKTPRSVPATYIGAFDPIRHFFAALPESKMRGYTATTFSFNTGNGRCPSCAGAGRIKLEMNFLPDTYVDCEACNATRYRPEVLDVRFKDKSIAEILALSFSEAIELFGSHKAVHARLELMVETGLGYVTLGQSSPTLSGGEAQRLKLVSELIRGLPTFQGCQHGIASHHCYLLEEPTIGLHLSDCERLIALLHRLIDQGHTVVVIEHHLDLIAEADYVVEIGPGAGEAGGAILYQGTVQGLLQCPQSPTAPFLRRHGLGSS